MKITDCWKQKKKFFPVISFEKFLSFHICFFSLKCSIFRRSIPLRKNVLKICNKFTVEHSCRSVISIKLLRNFIEITLRHGCSPVNLLQFFITSFPKNTSGGLLLVNPFQPLFFWCIQRIFA